MNEGEENIFILRLLRLGFGGVSLVTKVIKVLYYKLRLKKYILTAFCFCVSEKFTDFKMPYFFFCTKSVKVELKLHTQMRRKL